MDWTMYVIAVVGGCVALTLLATLAGLIAGWFKGPSPEGSAYVRGTQGGNGPLSFLESQPPRTVAALLSPETNFIAAGVLASLAPEYALQVIAEWPVARQQSLVATLKSMPNMSNHEQTAIAQKLQARLASRTGHS